MSKIRAAAELMRNLPSRGKGNVGLKITGQPRDLLEEAQLKQLRESMGMSLPGRGAPGGLSGSLRPVPGDISKAQALGITTAMGGIGGLGVSDLTEGFTESAKLSNSIFADPEELGRQAAKAKMTLQEIMDRARGKAEELGEAPQIYMLKVQSGYQEEMNNQQMQEPQRIYDEDQGMKPVSLFMSNGGEASFPDLTGDGQVTQADILKGRGVFAEGGEAEMQMSEQEAMAELESVAPEAKMVEQLVMAVMQMIQQGVSEEDVRAFLKEQGLDDEDIEDLFMIVMQQIEQGPTEEPIGQELQGMM